MTIRITCISKGNDNHENPNLSISYLGWVDEEDAEKRGKSTRLEMYNWIKEGGKAYVKVGSSNKVKVITAETSNGTKYVKTEVDHTEKNNLLSLKEC